MRNITTLKGIQNRWSDSGKIIVMKNCFMKSGKLVFLVLLKLFSRGISSSKICNQEKYLFLII